MEPRRDADGCRIRWGIVFALLLAPPLFVGVGCDEGFVQVDDSQQPDANPASDAAGPDAHNGRRTSTFLADEREVWATTLSDEPLDWLGTDTRGRLYGMRGAEVIRLDAESQLVSIGSRQNDGDGAGRGAVHAVEKFDEHRWLLSDESGLITMTREETFVSPLAARFDESPPRSIRTVPHSGDSAADEMTPNATVWLASEEGLFRWRDDRLHHLDITSDGWSRLLWGPPVDGQARAWFVSERHGIQSLAFTSSQNEVTVHTEEIDWSPVDASVSDGDLLWVVSDDGRLFRRENDGTWGALRADTSVEAVETNPSARDVWFRTGQGDVWHLFDGTLTSVPDATWGNRRRVHSSGTLVVSEASNLRTYDRHLRVQLRGRPDDGVVASKRSLQIAPSFPERVTELEAEIDGQSIDIDETREVTLAPLDLGPGSHRLTLLAWYDRRDAPVARVWDFSVEGASVTWTDDVKPLAETKCSQCHGPEAATEERPPLHTRQQWEARFSTILALVESGNMPRPVDEDNELSSNQIQMLEHWEKTGFPD